ncbi:heavy-metal-associated domain-containing protein [uncultured Algibacter sp.]|uniref:heavy-metal-associated domain-containing protein n=1 Tax=uncultured Algibacter sp. TaxID=298659 RepID=UPI00260777F0|nr:heavy metal-associated domain-containing protein [uncultured Algibacter sp.]
MKNIKHILVFALIATFTFSCKNNTKPEVKTVEVETESEVVKELDTNATYAKAEFTIDGMTCAIGCAATIQKKIAKMDGVKSATVDFDTKLAMVEYNEAKVTPITLEEAVGKVSDTYKVSDMKTIEDFSTKKSSSDDCKKECCKAGVKGEEKMACKADCKKVCSAKKEA